MLKRLLLWLLLISTLVLGASAYWVMRPLPLSAPTIDVSIEPNTSVRGIAKGLVQAGVEVQPDLLFLFLRLSGQARALRAGSYEINQGATALDVLLSLIHI